MIALAVLSRQPYSELMQMSHRELDTVEQVVKELNDAKGGKKGGRSKGLRRR